jgi:hypothetical protein
MWTGQCAPPSCLKRERLTGLSATDAWHRAESMMGHIQHLSLEKSGQNGSLSKGATKNEPLGHKTERDDAPYSLRLAIGHTINTSATASV